MKAFDSNRGIALIATLAVLLVVGLLVLASAVTGVIDRSVSANQLRSNAAYYVAQAGLDIYKTAIFRNLVEEYAGTGAGWCETPVADGVYDDSGNLILTPGTATAWLPSGQGEYQVVLEVIDGYLVLTSRGRVGDGLATVQLVAHSGGGPGSAWDNAILAQGATPGSKAINGNVMVYGSVHIVDGDLDGTFAISGTAGVYNNYEGKSGTANSDIRSEISSIVDSTEVDLCTRVKIAKGDIYLESGAVQLGTSPAPIFSIHLGDGQVCRERESTRGCRGNNIVTNHQDSTSVYLRHPEEGINSPYAPFDLALPRLTAETFDRYFRTKSLETGEPLVGCEWLYDASGNATLPPSAEIIAAADPPLLCGTTDDFVEWAPDEGGGHLSITGNVNIIGNLTVNSTVLYEGAGTLLVGENIDDHDATIQFDNQGTIRPRTENSYPHVNAIALLSTGDLRVGGTAAVDPFAALLYAHNTFQASKQVTIVGAVIANDFDLGNNVPKIAYHPDVLLAAELLCLPGTACDGEGIPQQRGALADIAIERR